VNEDGTLGYEVDPEDPDSKVWHPPPHHNIRKVLWPTKNESLN
jgi:hypothetical protein